ncbi:MAG: glycosyltransferase family protein [Oceanococcus sp.]
MAGTVGKAGKKVNGNTYKAILFQRFCNKNFFLLSPALNMSLAVYCHMKRNKNRIAYGIMGYGRGHAMRSSALIRRLQDAYHVKVYAGPDAYAVMKDEFDCELIPCIHYRYGSSGSIDPFKTVLANIGPTADLLFGGQGTRTISRSWDEFRPDLVISDSESWSHRIANARRIPRISIDHVGVMAYCSPDFPKSDALNAQRDRMGYLAMMGVPEFAIVSSFYPAPTRYPNVRVVGPILRDIVQRAEVSQGKHLMAYFNKGEYQFHDGMAQALQACGRPVIAYGTPYRGQDGNVLYKGPSQEGFVADMASSAAVISTAGHQLASECLWLRKPMLLLPEDTVEQRLNAHMACQMGIGDQASLADLSGYDIQRFLRRLDEFSGGINFHRRDGGEEAWATLQHALDDALRSRRTRPRRLAIRSSLLPA